MSKTAAGRFFALGAVAAVSAAGWAAAGQAPAIDPAGDTFGSGPEPIDVVGFAAREAAGELVVDLSFAGPVTAPGGDGPGALAGFVDLDTDADRATGGTPLVDFLTGLDSRLGDDFYVPLASYDAADASADLVADRTGRPVARVPMTLEARSLSLRLPLELLGGAGPVRTAAVVGNGAEVTDAVPNGGYVTSAAAPGPGAVLLAGDRFAVEVEWRDFEGGSGIGRLAERTADSAVFWFFRADNWELLVKVLDGCPVNGRVWVFAAAATNVEYLLRVTDTQTGRVREYPNPAGRPSPAVTDTLAFEVCP